MLLSDIRHRPPASSTSSLPLLMIPDSGPPPAKQGDTLGTDDNALSPLQTTTRQTGSRVMLMRLADTHARWSPRPPLDKAPRWTRPRWTRPPAGQGPRWTRPPAGQGPRWTRPWGVGQEKPPSAACTVTPERKSQQTRNAFLETGPSDCGFPSLLSNRNVYVKSDKNALQRGA